MKLNLNSWDAKPIQSGCLLGNSVGPLTRRLTGEGGEIGWWAELRLPKAHIYIYKI